MRILEFKFKILNLKTLSAGLFTNRVHGRETLAVSSLVSGKSVKTRCVPSFKYKLNKTGHSQGLSTVNPSCK